MKFNKTVSVFRKISPHASATYNPEIYDFVNGSWEIKIRESNRASNKYNRGPIDLFLVAFYLLFFFLLLQFRLNCFNCENLAPTNLFHPEWWDSERFRCAQSRLDLEVQEMLKFYTAVNDTNHFKFTSNEPYYVKSILLFSMANLLIFSLVI